MRKNISRRTFIRHSATAIAVAATLPVSKAGATGWTLPPTASVDSVPLGKSGLTVSRIAMGTGTKGYNASSNQTRLGMETFKQLAHHACERGIRFYDMAEGYGSMPFVGEAIKTLPREKITLLTKMWTHKNGSDNVENVEQKINDYRRMLGVEMIDILLMHCMTEGDWDTSRTHYMEGFSQAKEKGIIRAVGVSCHNIDALRKAAVHSWVDVIMARINPFGTAMDGSPDDIKAILATACKNGKGVIGMKIFGEGRHVSDDEREKSIRFGIKEGNIHCLTLGMESVSQIDDAVQRVMNHC